MDVELTSLKMYLRVNRGYGFAQSQPQRIQANGQWSGERHSKEEFHQRNWILSILQATAVQTEISVKLVAKWLKQPDDYLKFLKNSHLELKPHDSFMLRNITYFRE